MAKNEHYRVVARGIGYTVYFEEGWYFVELFKQNAPIHSYETLQAVKEVLYHEGWIDSKDADI